MKVTKYEHACFTIENEGKLLVIDPGGWTTTLGTPENIVGIVITHEHADHFDPAMLAALIAQNPDATIISHGDIITQLDNSLPRRAVKPGDSMSVGPFRLEFFGGQHATIHPNIPTIANLGVLINEAIYYPGDSFVRPDKTVTALALPVAAPWLKISEAMDFLTDVKPTVTFPTHDAILSDQGKGLVDRLLSPVAATIGAHYQRIDQTPLEIN